MEEECSGHRIPDPVFDLQQVYESEVGDDYELAKGKKYYVRIRTYKTVGSTKFYSGWSAAKAVTIRK